MHTMMIVWKLEQSYLIKRILAFAQHNTYVQLQWKMTSYSILLQKNHHHDYHNKKQHNIVTSSSFEHKQNKSRQTIMMQQKHTKYQKVLNHQKHLYMWFYDICSCFLKSRVGSSVFCLLNFLVELVVFCTLLMHLVILDFDCVSVVTFTWLISLIMQVKDKHLNWIEYNKSGGCRNITWLHLWTCN